MYNKKPVQLIIVVLLFISVGICAAETDAVVSEPDTVLMTYGEQEFTMRQVLWFSPAPDVATVKRIAEYWLDSQLLYEEALAQKINDDPKTKFLADMALKKVIASELIDRTRNSAKVDDAAVSRYYEDNKEADASLKTPSYLSFSHIQTATEAEAQAVRKRIEKGEDINALAKELSIAKDAQKGGKAGKYQEKTVASRFGDEFLQALLGASEGVIVGPVKNKNGNYEIARHEGKREAKLKPFEEVKERIRSKLDGEVKEKAVNNLLESLRSKAEAKVKKMNVLSEDKMDVKSENEENKK